MTPTAEELYAQREQLLAELRKAYQANAGATTAANAEA